jgi:membrane fusion protein (multidrug efflux system)
MMIAITLVFLFLQGCSQPQKTVESPPTVQTVDTVQQDVPVYTEWIGTTDGNINAEIRAQVQGYLISQNYREGDFVRKGQTLFEIDPRPFQAALDQAKGQLAQQQAKWTTAKADLAKIAPLARQNALSKKDLDDATGVEEAAHADVISAEATVYKATLDLGFTRIESPIDGIAGIAKTQIGNLVGPGSMDELTTVSNVDPIKVYVSVGEQEYLKLVGNGGPGFKNIPLDLILSSGGVHPYNGRFALADRQVDAKTGTLKLVAFFRNPGNVLRPGQFAKVRAETEIKKNALLVPQRAVTELQGAYQAAVVGPDNKIDIRPVKTGERIGSLWVIDEGLKPGEKVVVEGVQRIKQGMVVNPQDYKADNQPNTAAAPVTEQKNPAQSGPNK